ncbi:MAG: hypothetical protein JWL60_1532 [Gemmatimonadetes bacterium]|nr:hypothetical protein [Gemmatimonadota bacterium]
MSSFLPTWKPGRSGVTMNAEIPLLPRRAPGASVRAMTMMTSAKVPEVTQLFVPVRTQESPSRTAWQRSEEASEPASGSLRANAPIISPRAIGRSQRSRCASLPKLSSICVGSELCTLISTAVDASADAIASSASRYDSVSSPSPSCSSGISIPRNPSSPIRVATSRGKCASRSHATACGTISSAAKPRASSRICCWVSVRRVSDKESGIGNLESGIRTLREGHPGKECGAGRQRRQFLIPDS